MANKRIVAYHIVESDAFYDLEARSQLLYFHLLMNADNEGFIGNVTSLIRALSLSRRNLDELVLNGFVICFKKQKVALITHWLIHNPSKFFYSSDLTYPLLAEKVFVTREAKYTLEKCYKIVNLPDFKVMRKKLGNPTVKATLALLEEMGEEKISEQIRKDSDKTKDKDADNDVYVETEKKTEGEAFAADGAGGMKTVFSALRESRHVVISASVRVASEEEIQIAEGEAEKNVYSFSNEKFKNIKLTSSQASRLYSLLGVQKVNYYAERLSDFMVEKDVNIRNHYALIMKWAKEDGLIDA